MSAGSKERLPWIVWALVVHVVLISGFSIFIICLGVSLGMESGEGASFLEALKPFILWIISVVIMLAAGVMLVIKPPVGGALLIGGKVFGIVSVVITLMFAPPVEEVRKIRELFAGYNPTTGRWVLAAVWTVLLLGVYALVCLGLGYLIHLITRWFSKRS